MSKRSAGSISTSASSVAETTEKVMNLLFGVVTPVHMRENVLDHANEFEKYQLYMAARAIEQDGPLAHELGVKAVDIDVTEHRYEANFITAPIKAQIDALPGSGAVMGTINPNSSLAKWIRSVIGYDGRQRNVAFQYAPRVWYHFTINGPNIVYNGMNWYNWNNPTDYPDEDESE